jgi:hypothetical protein
MIISYETILISIYLPAHDFSGKPVSIPNLRGDMLFLIVL